MKAELEEFHDIEFEYKGKKYCICPVNNVYSVAGEDLDNVDYKTIDELISKCKIQGKCLKDIITKIDVYLH